MRTAHSLFPALALSLLATAAQATTTVYTSSAAFLSQVAAGAYAQSFDSLSNPPAGAVAFSGSGFSFTAFALSDIYLAGGFLGTSQINQALTLTFTGSPVTAIGANFFATDISDNFQATALTVTLSDGTVQSFTPTSATDGFRGFTSTVAITSLVLSAPGGSLYGGLDNLTVGKAVVSNVPEPANWAMFGLGLAGVLAFARRRAA
jgi:hypothetical protein